MESLGTTRTNWTVRWIALTAALLLVVATACAPGGGSAPAATGAGPRLTFKERTHDFGKVSASRKQQHEFAFTNTGSAPLQVGEITLAPAAPGG